LVELEYEHLLHNLPMAEIHLEKNTAPTLNTTLGIVELGLKWFIAQGWDTW